MRLPVVLAALAAAAVLLTGSEATHEPASLCAMCHRLTNGAPHALWAGSMMAHADRDPYWRAKVDSAMKVDASIEAKCLSCHQPAKLAGEGVTCTVCHQIDRFEPGRFFFNAEDRIFGPHENPFRMPMQHHTGYEATYGTHILDAGLCGACHTVRVGGFLEQATYLEWRASAHARDGRTCQSCHVPQLGTPEYIAHRPPGGPFPPTRRRQPVGEHRLVGGNYWVSAKLGLSETVVRAKEMLASAAALSLRMEEARDRLLVHVTVENQTGHKLPTGYPSRRVWLHVRVANPSGQVVFESGAAPPGSNTPHRDVIRTAAETVVYEAEMQDASGALTTSLVRARAYAKDNRILPAGFRGDGELAPAGVGRDPNFRAGSDTVTYEAPLCAGCSVSVEALYDPVKPGHAAGIEPSNAVVIARASVVSARPGRQSAARRAP